MKNAIVLFVLFSLAYVQTSDGKVSHAETGCPEPYDQVDSFFETQPCSPCWSRPDLRSAADYQSGTIQGTIYCDNCNCRFTISIIGNRNTPYDVDTYKDQNGNCSFKKENIPDGFYTLVAKSGGGGKGESVGGGVSFRQNNIEVEVYRGRVYPSRVRFYVK